MKTIKINGQTMAIGRKVKAANLNGCKLETSIVYVEVKNPETKTMWQEPKEVFEANGKKYLLAGYEYFNTREQVWDVFGRQIKAIS